MLGEPHRSAKQQTHLLPFALPVVAATRRPIAEESKLLRMPAKAEDDRKARIVKVDMVLFSLRYDSCRFADGGRGRKPVLGVGFGSRVLFSSLQKGHSDMTSYREAQTDPI